MAGVNKVILLGRLGKDPEVRTVGDTKVAGFSLATSESYKNKAGDRVEQTEWHTLEVWGKLAETAEKYVKKGSELYVEGKIKTDKYTDKDGNSRERVKIRVDSFTMIGGKAQGEQNHITGQPVPAQVEDDSDLPF